MKKIEKLTPEQEAELPPFRQRYLDIACGGGRIDRPALESALADAYAVIKKPAPALLIFDSPAASMLAIKVLQNTDLKEILRDQLGSQLWDQLGDRLGGQKVYNSDYLWGSQDLYWIAWARFAQYIGVELSAVTDKHLGIMERISSQCEWWWPFVGIVIASQRPHVGWDDTRRLHGEAGPAVKYADGYALYSWHGTTVPNHWIEQRGKLTAQEVLKVENVEQRAAGLAIIGMTKALAHLEHKIVDTDEDPAVGDLVELSIPGLPETELYLKFLCPRNGEMMEPVNKRELAEISLHHAHAWHAGIPPQLYSKPQQRS